MTGRLITYIIPTWTWSSDNLIEPPVIASHGGTSGGSASLVWGTINNQAILWSAGFSDYQGGRFNPNTLTWSKINMTDAPTDNTAGYYTSSVWSGDTMLTWASDFTSGRGYSYDPTLDSWSKWSTLFSHISPDPMFTRNFRFSME